MARQPRPRRRGRNFESYVEQAQERIREQPENALKEIGKLLRREIRKKAPKESGRLRRSIQYWYRRRDKDLWIGSKVFYASFFEFGTEKMRAQPFIQRTVMERREQIQSLIQDALRGLTSR